MFTCSLVTRHTDNEPLFFFTTVSIGCTHGTCSLVHGRCSLVHCSTENDHVHSFADGTREHAAYLLFPFLLPYQVQCKHKTLHLFLCCKSSMRRLKYFEDKSTHACTRHSEHPMDTGSAQGQCTRPQGNTEQVNK